MSRASGYPIAAAFVLSTCLACGAGSGDADDVRGMERVWREELAVLAETRLGCPRDRFEHTYEGNKVHLLEGCGKEIRYMIFQVDDVWVKVESFHERAAFELECDVDRLASTRETEGTWRVTGCDGRMRFTLSCEDDEVICTWIAAD
jgi:hypothetical protein